MKRQGFGTLRKAWEVCRLYSNTDRTYGATLTQLDSSVCFTTGPGPNTRTTHTNGQHSFTQFSQLRKNIHRWTSTHIFFFNIYFLTYYIFFSFLLKKFGRKRRKTRKRKPICDNFFFFKSTRNLPDVSICLSLYLFSISLSPVTHMNTRETITQKYAIYFFNLFI